MSAKAITRSPLSIIAIIICVITYVRLVNIPSYNIGRGGKSARVREVLLDPFDQRVLVCAHRCGNPPENSLSALSRAIAMNADIVEIDAAMTADGVVVLMHDRNVDRTTYGRGPVSELTLREFSELRLRKSMTGECPPTLEKFLRVAGEDLMVCIDMKKTGLPEILKALQHLGPEVKVSEEIRVRAKHAVDRMLAIPSK